MRKQIYREGKYTMLNKFDNLATIALNLKHDSKAQSEQKTKAFNALAFEALQIHIAGKIQDIQALEQAVSKKGKFNDLRQVVSNAKPIALLLKTEGNFTFKEGKVQRTLTLTEVIESQEPCFTVSTAYKAYLKAREESQGETIGKAKLPPTANECLKAAIENSNDATVQSMTVNELLKAYPQAIIDSMIAEGQGILAAEENASEIVSLLDTIGKKFSELVALDANKAQFLLEVLALELNQEPQEQAEKQAA